MATRKLEIEFIGDPASAQRAFAQVGASSSALERRFGTLGAAGTRVGRQLGVLAKHGALLGGAIGVAGVKSFYDFDQAMTSSLAIMSDVSEEMRGEMSEAAREVGRTTKFSATEAGEAYFFLASAGFDAQESLKAMPVVSKFAAAGNFDLATATDLATDAQSALGLRVEQTGKNIRNLAKVQDVLVKANTLSNATVEQFSESLTNRAGAALKVLGKDIEEGVGALAAFADQGVKGTEAGTALAIVLRDLQTAALKNKDAFKEHGVAVFDADGEMRNIADVIGDLETALDGMSDKQRKATLAQLGFQDKSQGFLLTLLGSSDAMREYEKELRKAGGTAEEVADKQLEGFAGSVELLKGAVSDAALEIGENLAPTLEELADILADPKLTGEEKFTKATDLIFKKLSDAVPKAIDIGADIAGAVGRGFVHAWTEANPLGKVLLGAAALRIIGGKGAIIAGGAAIGRFLGIGIGTGVATTVAGGAGGAAAGAAGGAGIGGAVGKALKNVRWAKAGGVLAGIAIADTVLQGFEDEAVRRGDDFTAILEREVTGGPAALIEEMFGDTDLTKALKPAIPLLRRVEHHHGMINQEQAAQIRKAADMLSLTEEQRDALEDLLETGEKRAEAWGFRRGGAVGIGLGKALAEDGKIAKRELDNISDVLARMPKKARKEAADMMIGTAQVLENKGKLPKGSAERISKKITGEFEDMKVKSTKDAAKMAGSVSASAVALSSAVGSAFEALGDNTNEALKAFGVKAIKFAFKKPGGKIVGAALGAAAKAVGLPVPRQQGGIVPGVGDGDRPFGALPAGSFIANRNATEVFGLNRGGMVPVALEPGERIFYPEEVDRVGLDRLMAINAMVPRQKGGIVELLGPHNDPAGHGGSNQHLHIAMLQGIVSLGKRLQKMGWLVGEHPAFGGIQGRHAPAGYHYTGQAIDVNWPNPAAEYRKIMALLPTLGGAGISIGAPKLRRGEIIGPDSPVLDLANAAYSKAFRAAQRYIDRKAAVREGVESGVGMSADGNVQRIFANVAKRRSRSKTASLALGMAGFAESGMQDLAGGHADSAGALQLRASQHPGVDPHNEGLVAALFLNRGFTGRGGANKLAAQGLPAHLVAQGVQGSAFASGSNYLAQAGPAGAWMRRYGLKSGGLVTPQAARPAAAPVVHVTANVTVNGSVIADDDLADVIADQIEDAMADIVDFTLRAGGRNRARSRQLTGRAGRA